MGCKAMTKSEALEVFGLPMSATPEDVKKAHRSLVMRFHPDHEDGDAEIFDRVQAAYETLKRMVHDVCPKCQGAGKYTVRHGLSAIEKTCDCVVDKM